MKNSIKIFAVLAAILTLASCQKEIETITPETRPTHSVSFVADVPMTKTTATIDGNKVNYVWTEEDASKNPCKFVVYEIVGENKTEASTTLATLKSDGKMELTAIFDGEAQSSAKYQAVFNKEIKSKQSGTAEIYDQDSDLLVSEIVSSDSDFDNGMYLRFQRFGAINRATLKNMEKGNRLISFVIESLDKSKNLAGTYDIKTGKFEGLSTKVTATVNSVVSAGAASASFVCLPVKDANIRVSAVTVDENDVFVAAYEKSFTKVISFSQGDYTSFGVGMVEKSGETIDLTKDETTTATGESLTWDRALVHIMVLKDESSTNANNYYPGAGTQSSTRFYNGSSLAIKPIKGLSISEIVFEATTEKYANALANSTWTNASASASGKLVNIIPTDGTKEVSAKISATTGHNSIEIKYGQPKVKEQHSVVISSDIQNGTVSANPTKAYAGETITLSATPDGGYSLNEWNVTTATDVVIAVKDNKFVMPDEDVTVSAVFVQKNDGSLEHPYTAAEAIAAIDANTGLTGKYVKGIVKVAPSFNATYSSLSYDIESGAKTLYIYSGRDLGNADFLGAEDLKAGDEVVVLGNLKKYTDKQGVVKYELDMSNYLISINGETQIYRGLAVSGQKTAFTVGDAFEFGGKALQVWRGKADVDVTASATFSGYDMSTEGKQTVTVTVGEESVTYEINVRAAGAETPKTYTLQFGKEFSDAKVNGYTSTWEATRDGFTWTMVNWNNNNAYVGTNSNKPTNWTYVKAGPKGNTKAHAMIETAAMPEAISKISITIDKVENGSITSIVLKSSTTDDFTSGTTIETKTSVQQGEVVFSIPSPQNGLFYQLDFTLNNTTSNDKKGKNGVAQVSKVVYTNN